MTPASLASVEELEPKAAAFEPGIEHRRDDIWVAIAAAVLGASAFLPWYEPRAATTTFSAWATGFWGPVIFFLALGSLALVVLRRLNVSVALPYPESLVHEAGGWLAALAAILKAKFVPAGLDRADGLFRIPWAAILAIVAGLALALLAGRISGKAPIVSIPGWYRGRSGKIGAVLLALVIGAGAAFAVTNSPDPGGAGDGTGTTKSGTSQTIRGKVPDCAKSFPLPPELALKPIQGTDQPQACVVIFESTKKPEDIASVYRSALQAAGWKFTSAGAIKGAITYELKSPRCGRFTVVGPANEKVFVSIILQACPK